ncbi:GAF and ANTAR domain-containing protein [Amycolatopsis sp.]|uniref:GAF and ANTAR domain-containing protein n=1 Tax=Amycolatopsis sp. TaxID=37632 RepID=UPI002CAC629A|nr:GAF and ANTAR domain-containing protein [Amycolatopsis sp.]HVV08573.1 GAF and ANTAR domain-containing protein [Amycolatopsis sp.]
MTELDGLGTRLRSIVADGGADGPSRVVAACVEFLPISGAAITLMTGRGVQEPLFASDAVVSRLDALQFSLGEGPCVEAYAERRPVLVGDLAVAGGARWPMFAHAAREMKVRGLFVFPLQLGAIAVGVLELYHLDAGVLAGAGLIGALRAADAALWSLLGLRSGEKLETVTDGALRADLPDWLSGTPLHRTEVYQATGMVVGQLGIPPATALAKLRGYAFAQNRPIDEVARDVVARRLRFDNEELG